MQRLRSLVRRLVARDGRWRRALVAAALLLVSAMYCTNTDNNGDPDTPRGDGVYRPILARGDGHMSYLMARSTALDLDWQFDNDLARFGDPWVEPTTPTGRRGIIHPIGPPLVWTPLIWLAEGTAVIANALGADIPLHGYTLWHQRIVFFSSVAFAALAMLLGIAVATKLGLGKWAATYAGVAILLGTSLTYYATYMPSYAHAMDAGTCAAFLGYWALTVGRRDRKRWIVLGVLLGIAALVRIQEIAMGAVVALEIVVALVRWRAKGVPWIAGGALVLAIALVVLVPQFVEWKLVFGEITELPQGARYTRAGAPMIGELLFAPINGWFSTTPLAYFAVIGLVACAVRKSTRLVGGGLLLVVAIQVYLNSTILDWWGGSAYGQRRLCSVTLPLVVGLATLLSLLARRARRWRFARARPLAHALAAAVLGMFVEFNLSRVSDLAGGKDPVAKMSPICCDCIVRPVRAPLCWLYEHVGNPFEFPANAIYAVKHGVAMSRWDQTVGLYPMVAKLRTLHSGDDAYWTTSGAWPIGAPALDAFAISGFGKGEVLGDRWGRRIVDGTTGVMLVPNLMPEKQRATLVVRAVAGGKVVVAWNGDEVARADIPPGEAWSALAFDLVDPGLHADELSVTGAGVEVSELQLELRQ